MTAEIRLTEKYQVMPSMPPEQFAALKADIAERGVLVPIDVDEDGHILDGHHRYRACTELGITDFPTIVRPGLTEEERRIFARKSNMLRRHLSRKQVRHLIAEQLKDTPSWANNRIGQVLGTDSKTVKAVRESLERTSEIPKLDKLVGADGKARPVKQKRPPAIMASNANDLSQILEKIEQGASIEEIQGFLSEQGFSLYTIEDQNYDPFHHCDDDGKRSWLLFMRFLATKCGYPCEGAGQHVEWVLQKQFKTPAEWLGEEGIGWRTRTGQRPKFPKKTLRGWEVFSAEHDGESLSDIEAMMTKESDEAKKAGLW
ncbi:MAG: ParB N-terminal domain-containing protein [Proteobacteria bacterium]|nr:ParB N-terminal domain-containing protein [Pseudomonadota bacterium]